MMEQWNTGILGLFCIALKKNMIYEINPLWIEKTSIEVSKNSESGKMPFPFTFWPIKYFLNFHSKSRKWNTNVRIMLKQIISGGQTGADQGALDAAIKLGFPHGGWIPEGRQTEDGILPDRFYLHEMFTKSYPNTLMGTSGTSLVICEGKYSLIPVCIPTKSGKCQGNI
jgi:hypothetical protein